MMLTFGSLFAGIGGIDLGFERAGWECRWQVEIDDYCTKVLERHWPGVRRFRDVRELQGDELERVDCIAGGFPCQPVSTAGARRGTEDDRWLWPEFARIVRVVRPRVVFVENVPGLLNVNRGEAMGEVLGDLASLGYDCEWQSIPAAALGAPHLRWRVFIVAYTSSLRSDIADRPLGQGVRRRDPSCDETLQCGEEVADTEFYTSGSAYRQEVGKRESRTGVPRIFRWDEVGRDFADSRGFWAVEPDVGRGTNGIPLGVDGHQWPAAPGEPQHSWEPPRVAEGIPSRVDRLRCLGNAVVPQVAEWVALRIKEFIGVTG